MGPIEFNQDHAGRLKRCSEKTLGCNASDANTEGCCAIVACRYCVTWAEYGEAAVSDITDNGDGTWTATPGGIEFVMTWERDYDTDECELVVTFDGAEVYRKSCYEGQSCRDSSDSVEVSLPYLEGTLTWSKDLKRTLPYVRDYETNCLRRLCADCDCTCECLCVSIVEGYGCATSIGEICDTAYDCDPPLWAGTVGGYDLTVALDQDCTLSATVDGEPRAIEIAAYTSICDQFSATITLDDGTVITVECRECRCATDGDCAVGCCWPTVITPEYPCGYLAAIPFEISAPGCDIDGVTGEFTPTGISDQGTCGPCAQAPPVLIRSTVGSIKVPLLYCTDTPCSLELYLLLQCDDGATTEGLAACCGGFRLWIGTTERFIGWDGTAPPGGDASLYWLRVGPSSCSCDPLALIFEVTLAIDCPDTWVGGPCDGQPKDCCDPVCGGFTLTI